ncbi:MAG: P-loop NTPase, partial [Thermotogaceae bacterium]|nr:P-loop NTPase [Thermotogaceae bacterium]
MVIAVLSGKGGTGKTTLATNLASAISEDFDVQLLDADAEEPDVHLFFDPEIEHEEEIELMLPVIDKEKC